MATKKIPLYQQIAESIRQEILAGRLRPEDRIAPVREMADRWNCTPGTVQQAYKELADQGLVVSRPGQGTRVGTSLPSRSRAPLRRATLVHQAETFLLEVVTAGYSPEEVEKAFGTALDRWRSLSVESPRRAGRAFRFVGSHDPAISLIANRLVELAPGTVPQITFTGSLGGLIALAEGKAEVAGSHLWDEASDTYNQAYIQRLLPGRRVILVTMAHRNLGLITAQGNPDHISSIRDLARPNLRFLNRQRGSGTRVWLDAHLGQAGIDPARIQGYGNEVNTHSEAAQAVAEGRADVALGVEAAALAYELGFVFLTLERYDIIMLAGTYARAPGRALADWLASDEARNAISALGGYDTKESGKVTVLGG